MRMCSLALTWQYRHCLECPEHPERPQPGQVPHLYEGGQISREDHGEVEPVPRVAEVTVIVQYESPGNALDHHLQGIDPEEDEPVKGEGCVMMSRL